MKLVNSQQANKLVQNIFSSSRSRSLFGVNFGSLSPRDKVDYVKSFYGNEVFFHQVEALDVFTTSTERNCSLNASRQTGKGQLFAWTQGLNAQHNLYPALDDTTKVISLANKESQSLIVGNRLRALLEANYDKTQFFWDRAGSTKLHLVFKREAGVNSRIMGTVDYQTANPRAFGEGFTASVIYIDEAGRLDQKVFSEVIIPFGGSTGARTIIAGVSRGKGPFYDICNSRDYRHIHLPWDKVETYRRALPVDLIDYYTGETILETGLYPLEVMPISLKKVLFPGNPICHLLPTRFQRERRVRLWDLSEGQMSENDFRSQYMLEWLAALMAILQLEDVQRVFESSDYLPLGHGLPGEDYWYGFDLGGARNVYAAGTHDKDTAALSIWRRVDGVKQKVFCDELYSCQPEEAVQWLMQYVHPQYGMFPCRYGAIDVTGAIGALTSEKIVASRLPVVPVIYNRTEETTKKNWKNAMFDYFEIEMRGGRVQYPRKDVTDELDPDTLKPRNPLWFKSRAQWEVIERTLTGGINAQISAPSGEHDDHPNSDVLCCFAMDRPQQFVDELHIAKQRAKMGTRSVGLLAGTGGAVQQFRQQFGGRR